MHTSGIPGSDPGIRDVCKARLEVVQEAEALGGLLAGLGGRSGIVRALRQRGADGEAEGAEGGGERRGDGAESLHKSVLPTGVSRTVNSPQATALPRGAREWSSPC